MLPARAADGNDQIGLSLVDVVRQQKCQQILGLFQKILRLLILEDEIANRLVKPCLRFQLRNVIGIRQKSHVKDKVRVQRQTVFEAERKNRHMHRPFAHAAGNKINELAAELACG